MNRKDFGRFRFFLPSSSRNAFDKEKKTKTVWDPLAYTQMSTEEKNQRRVSPAEEKYKNLIVFLT